MYFHSFPFRLGILSGIMVKMGGVYGFVMDRLKKIRVLWVNSCKILYPIFCPSARLLPFAVVCDWVEI